MRSNPGRPTRRAKSLGKLGQDGGVEHAEPVGDGPLGRVRKPRKADEVAARIAAHVDNPPVVEGVTPLAVGFFKLQRIRAANRV